MGGLWTLKAPFAAQLQTNVSYSVVAVRLLADIVAAGGDPYTLYYKPNNLQQSDYQADIAAGASIVSLQASGGQWLYLPNTYITAMPNQNNIPYTSIVLGVNLGPLPDKLDLTYVKSAVAAAVKDSLGIANPTVKAVAVSAKTLVSPAEDQSMTAQRQANMSKSGTPTAQLTALQAQHATLQQQYSALVTWIQQAIAAGTVLGGGGDGTTPPQTVTVTATFDPATLPAGLQLQASNMQVVSTLNQWQTARTTYAQTAGLFYAELTINRLTGAVGFGLCNQLAAANGELGADANSIMMFSNLAKVTSGIYYLGGNIDTIGSQAPVQGSTMGMAVNLNLGLVWFYNPITKQWNGDTPAKQNPVGNVGGISINSICKQNNLSAQVFPAASLWQVTDSVTFNPGSSTFVNPLPTGYLAWNTQVTGI
jgi:hypothetical protein